jgi:hypothetical protein
MRRYLMMTCCIAVAINAALAQQSQNVQTESNGSEASPSLPVTMQFIQAKIRDKGSDSGGRSSIGTFLDVVADPAKCELVATQQGRERISVIRFAFRDVEQIKVLPYADWFHSSTGYTVDMNGRNPFTVAMGMTRSNSVHIHLKKGRAPKKDVETGEWWVTFEDEDTANRVAKAMLHAVELCGGGAKPEPF